MKYMRYWLVLLLCLVSISAQAGFMQLFWEQITPALGDMASQPLTAYPTAASVSASIATETANRIASLALKADLVGNTMTGFFLASTTTGFTQVTSAATFSARYQHRALSYDGKMWVIGGEDTTGSKNDVWWSTDGDTWTCATTSANFSARRQHAVCEYDGKMWLTGGTSGGTETWWSTDGVTWTQPVASDPFSARVGHGMVSHDGKLWVLGGNSIATNEYTTDGSTWTTTGAVMDGRLDASYLVFDSKMWELPGLNGAQDVRWSVNGSDWTVATSTPACTTGRKENHASVVFGGKMWLTGGGYPGYDGMWSTSDGIVWDVEPLAPTARYAHQLISYDSKMWIIAGMSSSDVKLNDVLSSTAQEEILFGRMAGGDTTDYQKVASMADYQPVASMPDYPKLASVSEMINSTGRTIAADEVSKGAASVTIQLTNYPTLTLASSTADLLDYGGRYWEQIAASTAISGRYRFTMLDFADKMWIIAGHSAATYTNAIYYSTDGVTWTVATTAANFPERSNHCSCNFNGKMWVMGGENANAEKSDVWYSTNGIDWTVATTTAAFGEVAAYGSVVFDSKMWMLGESKSWYSTDGVTWDLATNTAAFGNRTYHTVLPYVGKMWVIAGNTTVENNDTYYSTDGITWAVATTTAAFSTRAYHSSSVYNGKMYVIGGNHSGYIDDIWRSSDGIDWVLVTDTPGFSGRGGHKSIVYRNKLWVYGGLDGSTDDEVWASGNSN